MARIRTIKPEFWTSEQIVECSPEARLLFIGIWNFADDAGIHPESEKQLKMKIFPGDDYTSENILRMLAELSTNGLIEQYKTESGCFIRVIGWHHQKIDKPSYKYPLPNGEIPENKEAFLEYHSSNVRRTLTPGREGKGREGKGKEGKDSDFVTCPSAEFSAEDAQSTPGSESLELQPPEPDAKKNTNGVPYQKIVDLYHEHLPELRQVVALNQARKTAIKGRWHNEIKSLESFAKYFSLVAQSDFLTGKCPPAPGRDSPWQADFDWLMKPSNVLKIVEGKYRD